MTTATPLESAERIHADHTTVKHLGHWTECTAFEVRARRASVVLDLRSPRIRWDGPVTVDLRLTGATVTLLLPQDTAVDQWGLNWNGRGRVKDAQGAGVPTDTVRRLRLFGTAAQGEVRILRGGSAQLAAMCSRAYLDDLRRARRERDFPTVDDPARELTDGHH